MSDEVKIQKSEPEARKITKITDYALQTPIIYEFP